MKADFFFVGIIINVGLYFVAMRAAGEFASLQAV